MSKKLLTGAASAGAFKIKSIFPSGDVLLGDYEPLPSMASLLVLPSPETATYIHDFLKVCLTAGVETVYPIRRAEIAPLLKAKALFEEYGIQLIVPENNQLQDVPAFRQAQCLKLEWQDGFLCWRDENETIHLFLCD